MAVDKTLQCRDQGVLPEGSRAALSSLPGFLHACRCRHGVLARDLKFLLRMAAVIAVILSKFDSLSHFWILIPRIETKWLCESVTGTVIIFFFCYSLKMDLGFWEMDSIGGF